MLHILSYHDSPLVRLIIVIKCVFYCYQVEFIGYCVYFIYIVEI
jgi:hypothetical protein